MKYLTRRFEEKDADVIALMIARTLRTTNIKDYSGEYIENLIKEITPEYLAHRAALIHFYVALDRDAAEKIIGCGAIGPYQDRKDESRLFTFFVHPEYQGKGIGRMIMETLESDEFFLRARRTEIPASITAVDFYRKMGYDYKNGIAALDEKQLYTLEKFRPQDHH